VEFHENHAAQTALEGKNQELQKAVLDMANRVAGERVKKNNKNRKAEESKDEQESAGKKHKKGKVSKDNDNSDEEDDGIDYTLEANWTIKRFTRHEKIVKRSGVEEYQLLAIWKGYKKDDPKRPTKDLWTVPTCTGKNS
jgi:hypothetical protein